MADEPTTGQEPETPTGGTPAGDAGETPEHDELSKLRQEKSEWLAAKTNLEQQRRDLDAERQRVAQTPPTTAGDPVMSALNQYHAELQYRAANMEPQAIWELARVEDQRQREARIREDIALSSVPVPDRDKVRQTARERGVSFAVAQELLEGQSLRAKQADLDRQKAELDAARKARENGIMGTSRTPVPADERKTPMKSTDYAAKIRELEAAGKDAEAAQLERDADSGRVQILFE